MEQLLLVERRDQKGSMQNYKRAIIQLIASCGHPIAKCHCSDLTYTVRFNGSSKPATWRPLPHKYSPRQFELLTGIQRYPVVNQLAVGSGGVPATTYAEKSQERRRA